MVIALLADIHANLEALRACLAHAHERGAERYAFLGDLVGYGADPGPVVDVIAGMRAQGAVVVKGNHDAAALGERGYLNHSARIAAAWTGDKLTAGQREFLDGLPLVVREKKICFVHATAHVPERWDYVDSPAAAEKSVGDAERIYTFSGHVHNQVLFGEDARHRMVAFHPLPGMPIPMRANRRWLGLVGSAGQPRDGNPSAAYAMADIGKSMITFYRVPYDHLVAAKKVRAAGLPEVLAYRLERGV